MKTKINRFIIIIFLLIIYIYVLAIEGISEKYVIFEGEKLPIETIWGLRIENDNSTIEISSNTGNKIIDNVRYNKFKIKFI